MLEEALDVIRRAAGRSSVDTWHRVGWYEAPIDFPPHEVYSWENRFDDPDKEYRTLYCAETAVTCIREVLADLRPNAVARAEFAQWQLAQGIPTDELMEPARRVTEKWREEHVLIEVQLDCDGPLVDLDDVSLRDTLERAHNDLLREHGMAHLDISDIRSKTRAVTKAISRDLYEQGAAGLTFKSNLDDCRCVVLFEGQGTLELSAEPISLAEEIPELQQVCHEYGLLL